MSVQADPYDVRLYCLMRTDLASMNPGKAVAQGMHAQAEAEAALSKMGAPWSDAWEGWKLQAGRFGTTITLGGSMKDIRDSLSMLEGAGLPCGVVHDPTYPIFDGPTLHLIPLDTCAWAFGRADRVKPLTAALILHP